MWNIWEIHGILWGKRNYGKKPWNSVRKKLDFFSYFKCGVFGEIKGVLLEKVWKSMGNFMKIFGKK